MMLSSRATTTGPLGRAAAGGAGAGAAGGLASTTAPNDAPATSTTAATSARLLEAVVGALGMGSSAVYGRLCDLSDELRGSPMPIPSRFRKPSPSGQP